MSELSKLLKISKEGELIILDIKKADGTTVIPKKSNEEAMIYLNVFDQVNNACNALWNEATMEGEQLRTSDKKQ